MNNDISGLNLFHVQKPWMFTSSWTKNGTRLLYTEVEDWPLLP